MLCQLLWIHLAHLNTTSYNFQCEAHLDFHVKFCRTSTVKWDVRYLAEIGTSYTHTAPGNVPKTNCFHTQFSWCFRVLQWQNSVKEHINPVCYARRLCIWPQQYAFLALDFQTMTFSETVSVKVCSHNSPVSLDMNTPALDILRTRLIYLTMFNYFLLYTSSKKQELKLRMNRSSQSKLGAPIDLWLFNALSMTARESQSLIERR